MPPPPAPGVRALSAPSFALLLLHELVCALCALAWDQSCCAAAAASGEDCLESSPWRRLCGRRQRIAARWGGGRQAAAEAAPAAAQVGVVPVTGRIEALRRCTLRRLDARLCEVGLMLRHRHNRHCHYHH